MSELRSEQNDAYRSGLHSAHAKIDQLEREKQALQEQLKEKSVKRCGSCGGWFARMGGLFWALFGWAFGLTLAGSLAFLAWQGISNSKPSGYCYIQGRDLMFDLYREISWGQDETVGTYRTMDEALVDAQKIQCDVRTQPPN